MLEVDEDVQARFGGSTSSLTLLVEETMEKAITITMFLWCTRPCIGKNKLVFPLFAAPTRQGTLSLCFFLVVVRQAKEVFVECCYFTVTSCF